MSEYETLNITSSSIHETERLAKHIGSRLRGGECIELVSDLGGGKTTFTRGLAAGAGSQDVVASPTFTISKMYKTEKFDVHHFDFYRLPDAGLAAHEMHDLLDDKEVVIVVEWATVVEEVLPNGRMIISFSKQSETARELKLQFPAELKYLVEGL